MGRVSQNVWVINYEELIELIDSIEEQLDSLNPMPHPEYVKGLASGLNLARECANRRKQEALVYDLEMPNAQA